MGTRDARGGWPCRLCLSKRRQPGPSASRVSLSPPGGNQGHGFWTRQTWLSTAQARPGLGEEPQGDGDGVPNPKLPQHRVPATRPIHLQVSPLGPGALCGQRAMWLGPGDSRVQVTIHWVCRKWLSREGGTGFLSEGRDPALPSLVLKCGDTRDFQEHWGHQLDISAVSRAARKKQCKALS